MDLFYPEIIAYIGAYIFKSDIELEINSAKNSHFDFGTLKFTKELDDEIVISMYDRAIIQIGYDGDYHNVFSGFVSSSSKGGLDSSQIILKDEMLKLQRVIITNAFQDATPFEIVQYVLMKAQITNFKLGLNLRNKPKKYVNVPKKNGIEVLEMVQSIWGITDSFFMQDGIFYFGEKPNQELVYTFKYAENIISLKKVMGVWKLETVSVPFLRHSHFIEVFHPYISGVFEVKKITFKSDEAGFIRSVIEF